MRTRELLNLHNTGHPGINSLFAKAHSADWDIENDVDWSVAIAKDDPVVAYEWTAFSKTPTFQALPDPVKTHVVRRGLARMLNILQVGESVAQDVCAKIALVVREEDYRNHAVAQAMDEARHHLAYRRFLDKLDRAPEDIDVGTEMLFDSLLAADDALTLIATEQFFLESIAMEIFEGIQRHARHPLLQRIIALITRDESRHMGFGVLWIQQWMQSHSLEEQTRFAGRWLSQILMILGDQPGPLMLSRLVQRMLEAGVDNADALGAKMLVEQRAVNAIEAQELLTGKRVPHLIKNARRAGLLKPEIVHALGLADHPLIAVAQGLSLDAAA